MIATLWPQLLGEASSEHDDPRLALELRGQRRRIASVLVIRPPASPSRSPPGQLCFIWHLELHDTVRLIDLVRVTSARTQAELGQNPAFADQCRARQLSGTRYPTVRAKTGMNTAVLVPHVVQHLRRTESYAAHWEGRDLQWS
ncbi:MAG: hypothetical protein Q8L05_02885 [Actinomycetota bacterium]|nr:hypothetical protein [Actinomycetota bacterium]MDP2287909.1 hypothetical protein [Actinomycetota bacterium]